MEPTTYIVRKTHFFQIFQSYDNFFNHSQNTNSMFLQGIWKPYVVSQSLHRGSTEVTEELLRSWILFKKTQKRFSDLALIALAFLIAANVAKSLS